MVLSYNSRKLVGRNNQYYMKRSKLPTIIVSTDTDGKEQKHKSLASACDAFGFNTKSVYQHFNRHKGVTSYLSKSGITLTKTTLI